MIVTFDFTTWTALYPEFLFTTPTQGQAWFNRASRLFANDSCNPANRDAGAMSDLLYMLTSHIAWLSAPRDNNGNPAATGKPPSPIVGRISSASEGSVSVSAEWNGSGSPSEAYFLQTRYGAEFWQATLKYRQGLYVAHPTFVPTAIFPGPWGRFRRW